MLEKQNELIKGLINELKNNNIANTIGYNKKINDNYK